MPGPGERWFPRFSNAVTQAGLNALADFINRPHDHMNAIEGVGNVLGARSFSDAFADGEYQRSTRTRQRYYRTRFEGYYPYRSARGVYRRGRHPYRFILRKREPRRWLPYAEWKRRRSYR